MRINQSKRKIFEGQIGKVTARVKSELVSAAAPTAWRLNSYSNLNSKKVTDYIASFPGPLSPTYVN